MQAKMLVKTWKMGVVTLMQVNTLNSYRSLCTPNLKYMWHHQNRTTFTDDLSLTYHATCNAY